MCTPEMDSVLIRFFYEEAVSGNKRCDNGWKPSSLKHVGELVGVVYGSPLLPKNDRGRLKTMKKEYSAAKTYLDLSGFTFNPETKLIEGDEIAWTDYLRVTITNYSQLKYNFNCFVGILSIGVPLNLSMHTLSLIFLKTRMLPYYNEMVMIFGKDKTNGSNYLEALDDIETDTEFLYRNLIDEIDDTGDEGIMPFPPFTPTDGEGFLSDMGMGAGSSGAKLRRRRAPGNNGPTKRSRSRFSNGEDPEIKQSFVTLAQAAKNINQSFQSPDYLKLGEIMSQMEDLTEEDVYAAMDVFSTQKESANVFLGCLLHLGLVDCARR
ncbi:hypothetical protein FRX31_011169 [Thalictrum thalictroides]|uniref:Myb/SANT-like domain-containing protein n=1 Tax=Thalictrum thalictroides TaxID=46969 RepID=A0A7J6WPE3_THATH|nr:hypothetical protein FRX31_011169 [Thalictrum thalictroides]